MSHANDPIRSVRKRGKRADKGGLSYRTRDLIRGLLGFVLLGVLGLLIWLWYWWFTTGTWKPLRAKMTDYVELKGGNPMGEPSPVKKLVVVNPRAKDLDDLHFTLPSKLQATRPEDVTTIVHVRRLGEVVGNYGAGGVGVQWTFEVSVYDNATKRQLAERTFKGDLPPFSAPAGRSAEGNKPIREVSEFLVSLAR